ncbi:MAG: copper amine oxidase N-terminal domain-containing protein [Clostridia bacterium]|nr:copper amine oxidase N-terminal domain-containing protein [Clostridia bacterium]
MKKITKRIMALMLSLVMIVGCIPSNTVHAAEPCILTLCDAYAGADAQDITVVYNTPLSANAFDENGDLAQYFEGGKTYTISTTINDVVEGDISGIQIVLDSSSNVSLPVSINKTTNEDLQPNEYHFLNRVDHIDCEILFEIKIPAYTLIIANAIEGGSVSNLELKLDGNKLNTIQVLNRDTTPASGTFEEGDYLIDFEAITDVYRPLILAEGSNSVISFDNFFKGEEDGASYGSHDYIYSKDETNWLYQGRITITIEANTPGPKTTSIMTAGGKDTGLTLTGPTKAVYGEDYDVVLDDENTINIATSGWKLEGKLNSGIFEDGEVDILVDNDEDMCLTIGDIDENDQIIRIQLRSETDIKVIIDITKPTKITKLEFYQAAGAPKAHLLLNSNNEFTVDKLHFNITNDAEIIGPGIINTSIEFFNISSKLTIDNATINAKTKEGSDIGIPMYSMADIDVTNQSKLISINDLEGEGSYGLCMMGSLNVDDTSECFSSGNLMAIYAIMQPAITDITPWKCSGEAVPYNSKNSLTESMDVIEDDMEYFSIIKDSDPLIPAKTAYKKGVEEPTSNHGSKKYKATDSKDTAEKITGSGKKGSTRTIVPEEGRKVANVIVTDKDGNKIDVTMNADGTFSFVQPASNVDVQVNYKNREIKLNIGSTEASVDGERENLDVCPVIRNDRTMLPIRFVAENLGAKVEWSEKNSNYVVIARGDTKIEITLGSDIMKVNGKDVKLDSVAFAENDRTYLPVRAISEALNAIVEWNENEPSVVKIYERQ